MPIDVDAPVIANTRLSDDYSVVALEAPEVASLAEPGQFVMIKPSAEWIRCCDGRSRF
jgi:NAD(P)H-flavin reductase